MILNLLDLSKADEGQLEPRRAKAFVGDIWLRLNWKKLQLEMEGAIVAGTIGDLSNRFPASGITPAVTGSTLSTSICGLAFGGTMYVAPS